VSESERIAVTRTVDGGADEIFAVLADPGKHTELDSSSMLRGLASGTTLSAVGDEFIMNMHNDFLGDYQIRNTVVACQPGEKIGWAPALYPEGSHDDKLGGMKPGGHTYTWELTPAGPGKTTITQIYDWSEVKDPQFKGLFPMLNETQLGESIDRAARAAT
jgi:hypothetical protein